MNNPQFTPQLASNFLQLLKLMNSNDNDEKRQIINSMRIHFHQINTDDEDRQRFETTLSELHEKYIILILLYKALDQCDRL
jgi:hypothetical protein